MNENKTLCETEPDSFTLSASHRKTRRSLLTARHKGESFLDCTPHYLVCRGKRTSRRKKERVCSYIQEPRARCIRTRWRSINPPPCLTAVTTFSITEVTP